MPDSRHQNGVRRFASLVLILTFLFGAFVSAPTQAAESCTKVNSVKVVSGAKFVCKKVGSKLQWVKQGSNAVVNNQPSSPAPSTTVKEWTKCPTAGKLSGSGAKGFVCVKVAGKLQWVKNSTLDAPIPKRPCRSEGLIGNWQDEVVLCTASKSGNTWQIPVFDEDVVDQPNLPGVSTSYTFGSPSSSCFNKDYFQAALDIQLPNGDWSFFKQATFVNRAACNSALGRFELIADLVPGTTVRMRVYSLNYTYVSEAQEVQSIRDVVFTDLPLVQMTPAKSEVYSLDVAGSPSNITFELVDYQKTGDVSVFMYRLSGSSSAFRFSAATNFQTNSGAASLVWHPSSGSLMNPSGLFQVRVKAPAGAFWVNRFSFDLSGIIGNSGFTKRIITDFTWR